MSDVAVPEQPLHNARNDPTGSSNIKEYFAKYPNSTASQCCRVLRLDYHKYGGRARKIKHDLACWRKSIAPVTPSDGRPLNALASVHRVEFGFKDRVPVAYVSALAQKAAAGRVEGVWYRSPNRNGQLEYFDSQVSVRVYPKSGTCRITPRESMRFGDVRVYVEDALAKGLPARALLSDAFSDMMNGLQLASRHRTFYVGQITPFKVGFYRQSLGLSILADGSHADHLEVHENWPTWIPPLLEFQRSQAQAIEANTKVLSDFASQIEKHLNAVRGIGKAADRLNEAVNNLTLTIRRKELV